MNSSNYESFNARNLTPEEVAETFIPSVDYEQLWRNDHTVVLGPRGSGKTTLFKMLTVQGIYSWNSELAYELRRSRIFTAIYVPTDMHWHHQLKHGEEQFAGSSHLQQAISRCAVTTSILLAVIRTFQMRIRYEAPSDTESEIFVSKLLIQEWGLGRLLPTFEMIALALKARINQIRTVVNSQVLRFRRDNSTESLPDYYNLDYFAAMDVGCTAFDAVFKLPQAKKWALCLDEMELAPEWLQTLALSQLRSSDQNYLIKISTSPIPSVAGVTGAQPKEDYQLISIWNYSGRDSEAFAQQLATSVLSRRFKRPLSLRQVLGTSEIVSDNAEVGRYERGSVEWTLFRDLAIWDKSFYNLLKDYGINPDDPVTPNIELRDSVLRKAKPIAVFRSAFLKRSKHGDIWLRSRKSSGVYYGTTAVLRVSDSNPRRLIGIINDLSLKLQFDHDSEALPLSPNEQDEVLSKASVQFLGYMSTLPGGVVSLDGETLDLATVLKAIASYFRQGLLGEEFLLDPKGSFLIDSHLNEKIIELIRLGIYHGAIVHVDPLPNTIETSIIGKRFRLSYMLAPTSRLPLTLYSAISLERILKFSKRIRLKRVQHSLKQPNAETQIALPM